MFKLIKKLNTGVRIGILETPHGKIETPFFMPVGTVGSVKGMAPWELEEIGAQIVLSNTYHLYLRPGEQIVKEMGGLHQFMGWDRPILTDSGGYQVFSLAKNNSQLPISNSKQKQSQEVSSNNRNGGQGSLVKITDDGVEFKSHLDGSKHLFTPEKVIDIQIDLGVDILMPLDVCPSGKASAKEIQRAVELTILWAKRAKDHFDQHMCSKKWENNACRPMLHGIVQGGMDLNLRKYCIEELVKINFDGYSIGGLAVDLETREMWDVVKHCCDLLPIDKQRYLMGVGTPDDIIHATKLGVDMFDCVLPTRLARHASVYIKSQNTDKHFELINLLNSKCRTDPGVIDPQCECRACQHGKGFSRAYISHLLRSNEILGLRLATTHNLWQYLSLMKSIRGDSE